MLEISSYFLKKWWEKMLALTQFVELWKGRPIDFDGAYSNQCWDLLAKAALDLYGCPSFPTKPGGGYVRDSFNYFLNPLPKFFSKITNDPNNPNQVPLPGDFIFWDKGDSHAAIVLDAKPGENKLIVFEQNNPVGGYPRVATATYDSCLGWFAPHARPALSPVDLPAQPAPTAPFPSGAEFYTISEGDTFWGLEKKWGLPQGFLQSLNSAQNPRQLRIGQQIRIKPPAAAPAPASQPAPQNDEFYVVQPGDTLWDLENKFGLSHGTLQSLNPEVVPRLLQIGYRLRVKPASPPPTPPVQAEQPATATVAKDFPTQKPEPVAAAPAPEPVARAAVVAPLPPALPAKQSLVARHFSKDKILKDLAALGTGAAAVMAWLADHHTLGAFLLSTLSGIIFGENRFKKK